MPKMISELIQMSIEIRRAARDFETLDLVFERNQRLFELLAQEGD